MILEKSILRLFCLLLLAGINASCSESENTEKPSSIILSADKNNLKSDGNEVVTFSISADGKDISTTARLFYKAEDNTSFELYGKTFSTNIAGTYSFFATYESLISSEVEVNAMPIILIFSADTTIIKANGSSRTTFSVTADGENVTNKVEFFRKSEEADILLENNTFTTDQEGSYEFYCKYNDHISNTITITAVPFLLTLKADATSIKANGKEQVRFSVTADDNDITSEAKIYRKEGDNNILLENNTFETTKEGNYEFFAQYQKQTSNPVSIEAIISRLTLTSDKTTLKTGENITFSAISDDINDVSSQITLHVAYGDKEESLTGNTYTPSEFGTYTIFATYDDRKSNTIEIAVSPANVTLSADKTSLKSTGADIATFTVYADGKVIDDADIYMKGETESTKINDPKFSSSVQGTYSFYAQYAGTKSEDIYLSVYFVNFAKISCAMGVVATWCGYSPEMINAFHQILNACPDQIQPISIHRSTSLLGSSDINSEEFMEKYGTTGTPFGVMDYDDILSRTYASIYKSYQAMKQSHPVKSGIAITSLINDTSIDVKLRVKVNETNEYSVGAIIVEDGIVKRQIIYHNDSKDNSDWIEDFVHNSVATYIMPGTNLYTGKSLGTIQPGNEVSESFSISLNKVVTDKRTVNHSNCRVVAYIIKKEGDNYYIDNAATCPVNGSVDFKYEE
ncbi:MAG: Omp28-related outer membrane protein [Tannerella sp.]|jgi:hypothetical protein|nr:Omp28-related outer membrane protein [Tannerella sp.]